MLRAWSCQVESMKGPVSQFSTTPTLASSRQSSHIDCLLWAQGGIPQPLLTELGVDGWSLLKTATHSSA